MRPAFCTCQPGRAHDGSEHGPCEYCENRELYDRLEEHLRDFDPDQDWDDEDD